MVKTKKMFIIRAVLGHELNTCHKAESGQNRMSLRVRFYVDLVINAFKRSAQK